MHVEKSSWTASSLVKAVTAGLALTNPLALASASSPSNHSASFALGRREGPQYELLSPAARTMEPRQNGELGPALGEVPDWSWTDVTGTRCGDGSATGMALSEGTNEKRAVLVFGGGGACDGYLSCYAFGTAAHLNGYTAETFLRDDAPELNGRLTITVRGTQQNPFYQDNLAFFPYCTGDIFVGQNVAWYPPSLRSTHHVGYANVGLYLDAVAAKWPHLEQVVMAGVSAGGFGAVLNFDQARARWPHVRIDVLDDSGMAFEGVQPPASWKARYPNDWRTDDSLESYVRSQAKRHPDSTFGVAMFDYDLVLSAFEKVSPLSLGTNTDAMEVSSHYYDNFAVLVCPSLGHGMLWSFDPCDSADIPDWLAENFAEGWAERVARRRALST